MSIDLTNGELYLKMGLERGKVVAAALRLLDDEGLAGLTTRRLARELGVQGPALYWHFENKQALTDAMVYALLADALAGPPMEADWVKQLMAEGRRLRQALLSHRDGARLFAGSRPNTAEGCFLSGPMEEPGQDSAEGLAPETRAHAHLANVLRLLLDAGFSNPQAFAAFLTVNRFSFGWAMDEQAGQSRRSEHLTLPESGDCFEFGLSTIIYGLKAQLEASQAGKPLPLLS